MQHAGRRALHQPHGVAGHPDAGLPIAAELLRGGKRPAVDQLERDVLVGPGGSEEIVAHDHRYRGAEQRELRYLRRCARRGLERRQRAQRVADQRDARGAGSVDEGDEPIGERLHRGLRRTRRAAVPGQVDGQRVVAVVREIARLQRPHAVIVRSAVDENHGRPRRIEGTRGGVRVGRATANLDDHAAFPAA